MLFEERLALLKEPVKSTARKYALEFHSDDDCSPEEALEKGISKAELEERNL